MSACRHCRSVLHNEAYSDQFCTHDCAMLHAGYNYVGGRWTKITDDDIRLYSVSAACGHVGEMVCAIALGRKVEGVLGHLTPSAARALVELEIERLRAQGSM